MEKTIYYIENELTGEIVDFGTGRGPSKVKRYQKVFTRKVTVNVSNSMIYLSTVAKKPRFKKNQTPLRAFV